MLLHCIICPTDYCSIESSPFSSSLCFLISNSTPCCSNKTRDQIFADHDAAQTDLLFSPQLIWRCAVSLHIDSSVWYTTHTYNKYQSFLKGDFIC